MPSGVKPKSPTFWPKNCTKTPQIFQHSWLIPNLKTSWRKTQITKHLCKRIQITDYSSEHKQITKASSEHNPNPQIPFHSHQISQDKTLLWKPQITKVMSKPKPGHKTLTQISNLTHNTNKKQIINVPWENRTIKFLSESNPNQTVLSYQSQQLNSIPTQPRYIPVFRETQNSFLKQTQITEVFSFLNSQTQLHLTKKHFHKPLLPTKPK